jgi:hypothetical protein
MLNVQQYKKKEDSGQNAVRSSRSARLGRRPTAGNVDPFG